MRFSRKSWKAQASAAAGKKKQFQNATVITRFPKMKKAKSVMNPLCAMWPLPKKTASPLMSSMRFSRKSWKAQASAAAEGSNPLPEAEDMTLKFVSYLFSC